MDTKFKQVVQRGCGIDIHRDVEVATIGGEGITAEPRSFKTFSRSLTELKEWLITNKVTHVAMESTGVYWKPVYNMLECEELTCVDSERSPHQVRTWSQDGQAGQCVDMQVAIGWIA